jgi:hypothetical protein
VSEALAAPRCPDEQGEASSVVTTDTSQVDDGLAMVMTEEDMEIAIADLLQSAGCTYEELKEQSRTGFRSPAAHQAWVFLRGLEY